MKFKRIKQQAVLCLVLAICLCGCKKNMPEQVENAPTTEQQTAPVLETTSAETQETVISCEVSGHSWSETEYIWINDDGACKAERTCEKCTKSESEVVSARYSGEGESIGIMAEFKNPEFETQRKAKDIVGTNACFVAANAIGKPGDTVEVALSLQNNPGIIALALQVGYDAEKLELIEVRDNGLLPNAMFSDSFSKNPYSVSWNDALARKNYVNNGNLAIMVFRIREQAKPGAATVSLTYSPGDVINWDLEKQMFATVNGTVTITENVPGETMFPIPQDPTLKTS